MALRALPSGGSLAALRGWVGWWTIGSPTEIEAATAVSNEADTALAIRAQAHAILALAAAAAIDPGCQR